MHMFGPVSISPSILSADFMNMAHDVRVVEDGGADFIHVDVMDGHFVPNLTVGVPFVKQLKAIAKVPLDVHLMIANPLIQVPWFLDAGADMITVHMEALDENEGEVEQVISMIHEASAKVGLSVKPDTPIESLDPYLAKIELVLIMSVHPGFSGQSFIDGSEARVAHIASATRMHGLDPFLAVDGGIGPDTVSAVAECGADFLIAGSSIFSAPAPKTAIKTIRESAQAAARRRLNKPHRWS